MAQEKSNRRVTATAPSKNTAIPKIKRLQDEEPNFYKCPTCGEKYQKLDGFPASQSELYAGWDYHLPICRKCLDQMFNHYTEVYGNDEDAAIRRICEKYDIYYSVSLLNASRKITKNRSRIHTYISKSNLTQYAGKTFDTTLDEERNNTISSIEDYAEKKANGEVSITKTTLKRWGIGVFEDNDYAVLEEHYKMLKENNPNADNNQEIFIKSLCHLNMLMIKALKDKDLDGYTKANGEYAKTFKQAGLKTVEEKDSSNDETFCMTLGFISDYTPEEFYQDKELYKDSDGIGDYIERHVTRPMINLETGSSIRDKEFFVPETDDDYDEE
ncbi:hypothetical protein FYJ38_12650 [Clostridium sp. WB02_MRS01]|uniref:hypothetical protein n=1 Tax=Clostridium sp. WB02_MRS01 TaxID=2605777 RepID=UPI0012B4022E|nr:hypothetical protein [Clostridium sp. WB02_MRS01]MSS09488.1 hypothetical protein [Clostridium sp. WB02_MRS01]